MLGDLRTYSYLIYEPKAGDAAGEAELIRRTSEAPEILSPYSHITKYISNYISGSRMECKLFVTGMWLIIVRCTSHSVIA